MICRPYRRHLTPQGDLFDETRELVAEFGVFGEEYTYETPDGTTDFGVDIRGHYFDLDAQAEQKGWDDEEKELVARKLLREIVVKFPGECQLYSEPPAVRPWPKYDEAHHNQIPVLADQFGCVAEALRYEKQNRKRESVIAKLSELLEQSVAVQPEGDSSSELVAV